jgi:hypothetical protein
MFRSTEANISCSNLSIAVTCEHTDSASSPTCLQSIGTCRKPGEPSRSSPDNTRPVVPMDPGGGTASPGATLPGTLMPAPRLTKSHNKPLTSSLSWGPTPSTSTQAMPCDTPSTPGITRTGASHASDVGSSNIRDSTTARLPMLIPNNATKGRRGDVTGAHHTLMNDRDRRGVTPTTLALPFKVREKQEKWERHKPTNNATCIPGGHR